VGISEGEVFVLAGLLPLWAMVIILAISNSLLLRQNLQLRSVLKKFEPDQLKPGDKLEPFNASGLNGESVAIDFASGGPRRVLMFLSPDCPYCREQFSYWKKLIDIAPAKGFQVVAVAMSSEDRSKLAAYLNAMGCPDGSKAFSVALIPEEVRQKYKLSTTPTTVVISSDGKADAVWTGLLKPADVDAASAILGL
jgi:peroxiredoxin